MGWYKKKIALKPEQFYMDYLYKPSINYEHHFNDGRADLRETIFNFEQIDSTLSPRLQVKLLTVAQDVPPHTDWEGWSTMLVLKNDAYNFFCNDQEPFFPRAGDVINFNLNVTHGLDPGAIPVQYDEDFNELCYPAQENLLFMGLVVDNEQHLSLAELETFKGRLGLLFKWIRYFHKNPETIFESEVR